MITVIKNGTVVNGKSVTQRDVWMEDGVICEDKSHADRVVDAEGAYILPGLIDIHTHGAAGVHYGIDQDYATALDYCAEMESHLFYQLWVPGLWHFCWRVLKKYCRK